MLIFITDNFTIHNKIITIYTIFKLLLLVLLPRPPLLLLLLLPLLPYCYCCRCFGSSLHGKFETAKTGTVIESNICHLHNSCVSCLQWFLALLLLLLLLNTTQHIVLLHLLQPNSGCQANDMQMQNLYSPCDEESNNTVISNWGHPQFAVHPQYLHLVTGFRPILL